LFSLFVRRRRIQAKEKIRGDGNPLDAGVPPQGESLSG